MRNPIRRNRNIGTAKQGHKRQNRFVVPESRHNPEPFCHQLGEHTQVIRKVNQKDYCFLVEHARTDSCHACTIDDLVTMLSLLDPGSLEGIQLIVLRQPKRKEETLCPVWGRLRYYFERPPYSGVAIILEAIDYSKRLEWPKRLTVEETKELKRLVRDGHHFQELKRVYTAPFNLEAVRATQLYRTLLHELGHYQQYVKVVKQPLHRLEEQIAVLEELVDWESDDECSHFKRLMTLTDEYNAVYEHVWKQYDCLSKQEKEKYAFGYSARLRSQLEQDHKIPFPRKVSAESLLRDSLREEDFLVRVGE